MDRTVSAPGKLFLTGEYAVLWGGVSRLIGVGPRVHAVVRPRDDRRVELVLESGRLGGMVTPLGVRWESQPDERFHFVATTVDLALRAIAHEAPGFTIAFESSPLVNGHKLGLGSSARATVLAAEAARLGLGGDFDSLKLALVAHADAQNGKGSGGDVATSFAGGFLRYRQYAVAEILKTSLKRGLHGTLSAAPSVELARLGSPGFPMIYAFSGEGASTTGLVKKVESTMSPVDRQRFVDRSDSAGERLERGLLRKDFADVELACELLQELLWGLGVTRHEGLTRVIDLARTFACAGKQSGAGGGDGAIIFAPDRKALDALLEAYAARGIHAFEVSPSPGLQGEATGHKTLSAWI